MRFSKIPTEFFQKDFLLRMGTLMGKEVKVDPTTLSIAIGKFVRVCVEIDFRSL